MEFLCNLNCPAYPTERLCCEFCGRSNARFVTESNRKYWTDESGFWKSGGCSLSRDEMPMLCRQNNCRDKTWVVIKKWIDGKWVDLAMHEVPKGQEVVGIGTRPATNDLGYSRIEM